MSIDASPTKISVFAFLDVHGLSRRGIIQVQVDKDECNIHV